MALIGAALLFATAIATRAQAANEITARPKNSVPTSVAPLATPPADYLLQDKTENHSALALPACNYATPALKHAFPIERAPLTLLDVEMIPRPPVKFTSEKYRARRA